MLELNNESSSVRPDDSLHERVMSVGGEALITVPVLSKKTGILLLLNLIV
jgi:hypothetical protein